MTIATDILYPKHSGFSGVVIDGQTRAWEQADSSLKAAIAYLTSLENIAKWAFTIPNAMDGLGLNDADIRAQIAKLMTDYPHGISAAAEQQIWDKAREKVNGVMQSAITQASRALSAAGWEQPQGALAENISQATQAAALENSATARDLAIQQAQWEVENLRVMIDKEIQLVLAEGQITLQKLQINIETAKANLGYLIDAAKAGSQISTQLAASALSALSYNSSMSTGVSASTSQGHSISHDGSKGNGPFLDINS